MEMNSWRQRFRIPGNKTIWRHEQINSMNTELIKQEYSEKKSASTLALTAAHGETTHSQ